MLHLPKATNLTDNFIEPRAINAPLRKKKKIRQKAEEIMDGWLISEEGLLRTISNNRYREKRKLPFRKEGAKTII